MEFGLLAYDLEWGLPKDHSCQVWCSYWHSCFWGED